MNKYQFRNWTILIVLLTIILLIGGYMVLWMYPGRINAAEKEFIDLDRKIRQMDGIEAEYQSLERLINEKEIQLASFDKLIKPDITTADVYGYLNTILSYSGIIEFNLTFKETKNLGSYGYNSYVLSGEAQFHRIYNFVTYLEQGPYVYEIEKLDLRGLESKNPDTERMEVLVPFQMDLRAYFASVVDMKNPPRKLGDVRVSKARNPFYPYILRNIPPNLDNLLDVQHAVLKAIIPGKALLADENGEIQVLSVGDRVYLGYLTRIIGERNEVEFTLNKGGIIEKFLLTLDFDDNKERK